jgi:hypothetical protein
MLHDECESLVLHYSSLTCTSLHHCGPMFREGARVLCGECGRLVDVIPAPAHTAHQRYRNRFIPVYGVAQR